MSRLSLFEERLTGSVIGAFYEVYNSLGFGFLESLYVTVLEREIRTLGHQVAREVAVRVAYKGEDIGTQRMDMIVDDKLLIEVKSTLELPKIWRRQVLNYLKATNLEVGLLLHFGPDPRFYRLIHSNRQNHPVASAVPVLRHDKRCSPRVTEREPAPPPKASRSPHPTR